MAHSGHQDLGNLVVAFHVTGWNLDSWTGGTYSTLAVGGRPEHRVILGTAIEGKLCLAGEHVSVAHPATMHGAYNSGVHAAGQLIEADRNRLPTDEGNVGVRTAIVIGAGLAGLAAAQTLCREGYDVTVLEATDNVGGRARTETLAHGVMIHPGAAWIHGPIGNPIAEIADQLNIERVDPWPRHTTHRRSDGSIPTASEVARIDREAAHILETLRTHGESSKEVESSMRAPLASALETIADTRLRSAVKVRLDLHFESLMAADLDNLSSLFGDEPYAYPGGDQYISTSLAPLTHYLASSNRERLQIRYGAPVQSVHLCEQQVDVVLSNETVTADVCVVAVPLGPLQNKTLRFEPPLPPSHLEALSFLNMGHKCKVYIHFSERWWGNTDRMWLYPANQTATNEPTAWALWVDASMPSGVPMLCGFLGGSAAQHAQRAFLSETGKASLLAEALAALRSVVP
jgi:monoamine oxidase